MRTLKALIPMDLLLRCLIVLHHRCLCWCWNSSSLSCVWRVELLPSDIEAGFITTNSVFQVSYLDTRCTQGLQWDVSSGCVVNNQSSVSTKVKCRLPGYHEVTPVVHQPCSQCISVGRTFAVMDNPLCFKWHVKSVHKEPIWSYHDTRYGQWTSEILQVWVLDCSKTNEDPNACQNVDSPSKASSELTRLFYARGQRPAVQHLHSTNQQKLQVDNVTFSNEHGYWEMSVQIPVYSELELQILGWPEVAVNNCFIRDTSVLLTNHWMSTVNETDTSKFQYADGYPTRVVQDPCASQVAVLLSQKYVVTTEDSFLTSRNLSLPVQSLHLVESLAFTPTHLVLLTDSQVFALHRTFDNFTHISGLSGQTAVRGRDSCIPSMLHRSHYAASFNASSLFLISTVSLTDERLSLQEVPLPLAVFQMLGFTANLTYEIQDVAFPSTSDLLGVVTVVTDTFKSAVIFLVFDITSASWEPLPFWLGVADTYGSVSILFIRTAHNASFLFWDQKKLYYYYANGQYGSFAMRGSGTSMLITSTSEVIKEVAVSESGDIIILLSSNRLLYSRVGLSTLINLAASEHPATPSTCSLLIDQLSNLFIIKADNASEVDRNFRWRYPLDFEIAGVLGHSDTCPYKMFEHSNTASIYFLDIGDVVKLWASLTFSSRSDVALQVVTSSPDVLLIKEEDSWAYHPGWLTVNKTLTVQTNLNHANPSSIVENISSFTGEVSIEVKPDQDHISCKRHTSMMAHFVVGCPLGRHIRVRKPDGCRQFRNYTIPSNAYVEDDGSLPLNSKIVDYDWSSYACPILCHYQQPFRPVIELYDHDQPVSELTSNYVVTEEQQRTDFSFNATMRQIYQSCFISNTTTVSMALWRRPYEVLNSTGIASIVWSTERNDSIYQFTATVVDPGYSFCHLQAKFAVRVYGHLPTVEEKPITPVSLGVFALLTFALGVVSYIYYRKIHIKKLKQQLVDDYDTD